MYREGEKHLTFIVCFHLLLKSGEGNGNPLQYSCLENPREGGAWWAAVYWVAQSWKRLKRLSRSNSCCLRRREKNVWHLHPISSIWRHLAFLLPSQNGSIEVATADKPWDSPLLLWKDRAVPETLWKLHVCKFNRKWSSKLKSRKKIPWLHPKFVQRKCSLRELILLITQDQVWNECDKGHCG